MLGVESGKISEVVGFRAFFVGVGMGGALWRLVGWAPLGFLTVWLLYEVPTLHNVRGSVLLYYR